MKAKVAIFKNVEYGYESVCEDSFETMNDYVRTTEYVEIEFTRLGSDELVKKEIATLESAKKKIQAETEVKLGEIDRRIGDLLALPQPKGDI